MFFKAHALYYLVLVFLVCDSAIAADCTGITTDHTGTVDEIVTDGKFVTMNSHTSY